MILYYLPVAGLAIGFLISLMGGGGGIFYIIILTGIFHLPVPIAASTSLATIIPTTLMASSSHYRQGNIRVKVACWLILGAVAGALAGSYITGLIPVAYQKKVMGLIMLGMLIPMARRRRHPAVSSSDGEAQETSEQDSSDEPAAVTAREEFLRHTAAVLYGLCGGLLSGMIGISGTPPILAGLYALGLKAREVVGTSLVVLLAIGVTGLFAHSVLGAVNWPIILALGIGTVTGAFLGPLFLSRVNTTAAEKFYGHFFFILVGFFGLYIMLT